MSMFLYITNLEASIADSLEIALFSVHATRPGVDNCLQLGGAWPPSIRQDRERWACRIRRAEMLITEVHHHGHSYWHTNCFTTGQQSAASEAIVGVSMRQCSYGCLSTGESGPNCG
jgi:hypothetical protein